MTCQIQLHKLAEERAKIIAEYQDKGDLVPFDIVLELLKERILKFDCDNGYILDGYTRTVKQAEMYDEIVSELNKDLGMVIVLDIDKELLVERITGRRLCRGCDAIYNIYINFFLFCQEPPLILYLLIISSQAIYTQNI